MNPVVKEFTFAVACLVLAVPHTLSLLNFRRRLAVKRRSLIALLSDPNVLDRYKGRFPFTKGLTESESIASDYFATYYNGKEYRSSLALNFITGCLALLFATARIGFPLPSLPPHIVSFIQNAKWGDAVVWSLIGSYLWNCYDLILRTTNFDLTPDALTKMWLKIWIAAAVASIISGGIIPSLQPVVGFAIGLISIPELFEIVADRTNKVLNVKTTEGDTSTGIKALQGATSEVIDTLRDLDIESTVQLAYCDPMNVMMSTNLAWVVIIDLIDQALLFNYIGMDVAKVRGGGYRGSIEVATIGALLNTPDQRIVGMRSLGDFAALLGWSESKTIDLVQTLYGDSQVSLIWELFGGSFAKRDKTHLPDAEIRTVVIKEAMSTTAILDATANGSQAVIPVRARVEDNFVGVAAQSQESQISIEKQEIKITSSAAAPPDANTQTNQLRHSNTSEQNAGSD